MPADVWEDLRRARLSAQAARLHYERNRLVAAGLHLQLVEGGSAGSKSKRRPVLRVVRSYDDAA